MAEQKEDGIVRYRPLLFHLLLYSGDISVNQLFQFFRSVTLIGVTFKNPNKIIGHCFLNIFSFVLSRHCVTLLFKNKPIP